MNNVNKLKGAKWKFINFHNEMMDKVKVGKIMGTHALKGELKRAILYIFVIMEMILN